MSGPEMLQLSSEGRSQEGEQRPLVAVAPDAPLPVPEEGGCAAAEVWSDPAVQSLEQLRLCGKISQAKVDKVRANLELLADALKSGQDSELRQMERVGRLRAQLGGLEAQLEPAHPEPAHREPAHPEPAQRLNGAEGCDGAARRRLLQAANQLRAAQLRQQHTRYQLQSLRGERTCLLTENENLAKPAELQSRTKGLRDKCAALREEVAQRHTEMGQLTADVESSEMQILREQKELEDMKETMELKEAEQARLVSIPEQIVNEVGRKRCEEQGAEARLAAAEAEVRGVEQRLQQAEEVGRALRAQREAAAQEARALKAQLEAGHREARRLAEENHAHKEEQAEVTRSRGILELKLQDIQHQRRLLQEALSLQLRLHNRQLQSLHKAERAAAAAAQQLQHTALSHAALQAQVRNYTQVDAAPETEAEGQQRMELQREVDTLKVTFEKQQMSASEEKTQRKQQKSSEDLLEKSNRLTQELNNLRILRLLKAEERGTKHREMLRAEQLYQRTEGELKEKELIILNCKKLTAMLQRRISQYSKMCDMFTEEKNKYIKLQQINTQTITELMEKVRLLENMMEIQRSIDMEKNSSLKKAQIKIFKSCKIRDRLRNKLSKHRHLTDTCEDHEPELQRMRETINIQEQMLVEINQNHETAVQRRNALGIQLLEHEHVLLSNHKLVKIQEAATTKGGMVLEALEKELRDMEVAINEEKRQIDYKEKEMLVQKELEDELTLLLNQWLEARHNTEQRLKQEPQYRPQGGTDPSAAELSRKMEQLESTLRERDRQLQENQLLMDQVSRLSAPLRLHAETFQEDRQALALKLVELRSQIRSVNDRFMATSAELCVKQAHSLSLQQEIKEKELQKQRWLLWLEHGLPPGPDVQEEWRRMLRDRERRQLEQQRKKAEEEEWRLLPSGIYTTAEARPDAYINDSDLLPLPKPYGAKAPYKPTQLGATMRHIRPPRLKPLEKS